jgi:hypothetical protein
VRVQVVSDSALTVRCGSGHYARRAHGCLRVAGEWSERDGDRVAWRHVRRDANAGGTRMDARAGTARRREPGGVRDWSRAPPARGTAARRSGRPFDHRPP